MCNAASQKVDYYYYIIIVLVRQLWIIFVHIFSLSVEVVTPLHKQIAAYKVAIGVII